MPTLKTLAGGTLAVALGALLVASPALSKDKKDSCHRSCAASNDTGEACMRSCPPAEGSTSGLFLKCAKRCDEKAEEAFKKCVSDCGKKRK